MISCRIRRNVSFRSMDDLLGHVPNSTYTGNMPSVDNQKKTDLQWFVMRDLKRTNAKLPAYQMLSDMGMEVFTPMVWKLVVLHGKRIRKEIPFMQDLLFVHERYEVLAPVVENNATLQFRFLRDGMRTPMTVREADMERFKKAVKAAENPCFYAPNEVKPDMMGKRIRIVGGPLDGYEGYLQKMQGARTKRLFVELPNVLTAAVEVQPEFIQIVK